MNHSRYQADPPSDSIDSLILLGSGPEPRFDGVMQCFLLESYHQLQQALRRGGLLQVRSLGVHNPWLYRLQFATRGYVRHRDEDPIVVERHVVALRFLPDHLRYADRFAMLRLLEPQGNAFHPNLSVDGAICVEIYPGESVLEICHSLHDLFRWRLRQFDERDALNPIACGWGRDRVEVPIDDRPLFGSRTQFGWQSVAAGLEGQR